MLNAFIESLRNQVYKNVLNFSFTFIFIFLIDLSVAFE